MAARMRWIGEFIVDVRGMSTADAPPAYWYETVNRIGDNLQEQIEASFAAERVAGSSQLGRNTPRWNAYKARKGLDPRRGHATGHLQEQLGVARLFQVRRVPARKGTVAYRIYFQQGWLHSRVPYAEYYEQAKVRRKGILSLAKSWVRNASIILHEAEAATQLRGARRASYRGRGLLRRLG
jgi:hypothetical protein